MAPQTPHFPPRAKNVIFLNMVGGPSQLDLFDWKPELARVHGQAIAPEQIKDTPFTTPNPDGYFYFAPPWKLRQAGRNGAWLSELLPYHELVLDHLTFIRSMHTDEFNHVPAQLLLSTGSPRAGRPTMGSWITYGLGSESSDLPGYVVMQSGRAGSCGAGCWSSGFLPGSYQGIPFRAAGDPVLHTSNPPGITAGLRRRSLDTIRSLNEASFARASDPEILARIEAYELAARMQTSVPELTKLSGEPAHILRLYGAEPGRNTFANHCLLARRLVERGVRFVQLDHGNWDHHGTVGSNLMDALPERCRAVDQASAALVLDLAQRGLLAETLVIWGGEFGRHPAAQGKPSFTNAGRDHQRTAYTIWLAGGREARPALRGNGSARHVRDESARARPRSAGHHLAPPGHGPHPANLSVPRPGFPAHRRSWPGGECPCRMRTDGTSLKPVAPGRAESENPAWSRWGGSWMRPLTLVALLGLGDAMPLHSAEPVTVPDFQRHIRPLLTRYCLGCHGPDEARGGLQLDRKPVDWRGGKSGRALLVPGNAAGSELFRRVTSSQSDQVMPARGARLEPPEVDVLRRWIDGGAPWPEERTHWAFVRPVVSPLPSVSRPSWPRNGVDYFILSRLDREGLAPSPEADRHTLIRRLSLDLAGLPPTVEEADAFATDSRADAYERLVERLLASPHYGERQARFWLELARFADTNGYELDRRRPVWPWRDWVIGAFNRNLPYDQFTVWQLAGDLLPEATDEQRLATGYHRQTLLNDEGGVNPEEFRVAAVMDRVETTATVWLGLTFNCAQCHSHKHDPISQREYYQFYAFMNQTRDSGVGLDPVFKPAPPELQARAVAVRAEIARCDAELRGLSARAKPEKTPPDSTAPNLRIPAGHLTPKGRDQLDRENQVRMEAALAITKRRSGWRRELEILTSNSPPTLVLEELSKPRQTHVLLRGDYRSPGEPVGAGVPRILHPWPARAPTNRLGLARWLVNPDNPLVARVTVNRVWEQHFGRSLVPTPDDFGTQGEPPSHPELLDWLAVEFMRTGWDLKALHRLMVTAATYRQSTASTVARIARDPFNVLVARGPRHRLDAEQIHDLALAASGRLTLRIGGPSVFPPQPPGIWEQSWAFESVDQERWVESSGGDRYRRGLYTFIRRTALHPTAAAFDMDNRTVCRVRRSRTNTPLQALTTLNDQLFLEAAGGLGERMRNHAGGTKDKLVLGFRCCVTRPPEPGELAQLSALLTEAQAEYERRATAAAALVRQARSNPAAGALGESAAWVLVANALLNLDETLPQH